MALLERRSRLRDLELALLIGGREGGCDFELHSADGRVWKESAHGHGENGPGANGRAASDRDVSDHGESDHQHDRDLHASDLHDHVHHGSGHDVRDRRPLSRRY